MKFGEAIEALREGKMVRRSAHRDYEFIFMQVPSTIPASVVPNMTSLPQAVKDEFANRFNDPAMQVNEICYNNQLAFVNASNLIVGWSPSVEDVLAEDWMSMEYETK